MSEYIHKSHNVTVLLYHLVFPAKYRKVIFEGEVEKSLKEVCLEIEKRYHVKFLEIDRQRSRAFFSTVDTDLQRD
jgi:putative transposase